MKTLNERLNKQINDSESRRVDLQREFDWSIADHKAELDQARADWKRQSEDFVETIRKRDKEIEDLKKKIYDNQQAFDDERWALKRHIDSLQSEVAQLKDKLVILDEIKEQRDLLMANLKKY
jgi:chromosome segregation ATPase